MKYIMRLDDACPKYDKERWQRMEELLNAYGVRPLVGIIPDCADPMMERYPVDESFWDTARAWQSRGWCIALHGYDHVYITQDGGINPVHQRSEFAGLSLEQQREKIRRGMEIFRKQGLVPKAFIAPSHTFDLNTLEALRQESDIRIISDTIANAPYSKHGFTFVPQQSGRVRELKLDYVTFCYHPNMMKEADYIELEGFLRVHEGNFVDFPIQESQRNENLKDLMLSGSYFAMRRLRKKLNGK